MKKFLTTVVVTLLTLSLTPVALAADAWPDDYDSGTDMTTSIAEPSGITMYDDSFWIVDDGGYLYETDTSGTILTSYTIGYDLEGITVAEDMLRLLVENSDAILEFDPSTGALTSNSWDLTGVISTTDNLGPEAYAHVEGLDYVGVQETGDIYVLELGSDGSVTVINTFSSPTGYVDISGMHYANNTLYTVNDNWDSNAIFTTFSSDDFSNPTTLTIESQYTMTGENEEGIYVDEEGNLYIAEDSGAIVIYTHETINDWPDYYDAGTTITTSINEPSGIVVYGDQLWVNDDDGYLYSMDMDGSNLTEYNLGDDIEGITTMNDMLYAIVEEPEEIREIDPETGSVTNTWGISAYISGDSNQGGEAITSAGDYLYVGYQSNGNILVFDISSGTASLVNEITSPTGYTDITGLHYADDGYFYAMYDENDKYVVMSIDDLASPTAFTIEGKYTLPADTEYQQGIYVTEAAFYIAQDSSTVTVYSNTTYVEEEPAEETDASDEETETDTETDATDETEDTETEPDYSTPTSYDIDYDTEIITITCESGDTYEIGFRADLPTNVAIYSNKVFVLNGRLFRVYENGTELFSKWVRPPR